MNQNDFHYCILIKSSRPYLFPRCQKTPCDCLGRVVILGGNTILRRIILCGYSLGAGVATAVCSLFDAYMSYSDSNDCRPRKNIIELLFQKCGNLSMWDTRGGIDNFDFLHETRLQSSLAKHMIQWFRLVYSKSLQSLFALHPYWVGRIRCSSRTVRYLLLARLARFST